FGNTCKEKVFQLAIVDLDTPTRSCIVGPDRHGGVPNGRRRRRQIEYGCKTFERTREKSRWSTKSYTHWCVHCSSRGYACRIVFLAKSRPTPSLSLRLHSHLHFGHVLHGPNGADWTFAWLGHSC